MSGDICIPHTHVLKLTHWALGKVAGLNTNAVPRTHLHVQPLDDHLAVQHTALAAPLGGPTGADGSRREQSQSKSRIPLVVLRILVWLTH